MKNNVFIQLMILVMHFREDKIHKNILQYYMEQIFVLIVIWLAMKL